MYETVGSFSNHPHNVFSVLGNLWLDLNLDNTGVVGVSPSDKMDHPETSFQCPSPSRDLLQLRPSLHVGCCFPSRCYPFPRLCPNFSLSRIISILHLHPHTPRTAEWCSPKTRTESYIFFWYKNHSASKNTVYDPSSHFLIPRSHAGQP